MARAGTLALIVVMGAPVSGQREDLDALLRFDGARDGEPLPGWGGGPPGTVHADTAVVRSGDASARLERDAGSPGEFSTITAHLPIDFAGETIELRGFLRTEGVTGYAGLWMRLDGPAGAVQFDNMGDRGVHGSTEWTEHAIRLPLDARAHDLFLGVLLVGEGRAWADDLQVLVDGKPIAEAPARRIEPTILDRDQEFAAGSGITVSALTPEQSEHVAVLGLVWGFLKYHHPRVTAGDVHWDFELFRRLPAILDARDRTARNRELARWVEAVGRPERCDPCAQAPTDTHLVPGIDWIRDVGLLGPELSAQLVNVHADRFSGQAQFYVAQVPGIGNPVFDRELPYADARPPDAGYRILSILRLWNIVEYWFPYRDLIDDDWHAVLREFLPRIVAADDWDAYRLELLAFVARLHDTHANLWTALDVRPPRGECYWPLRLRFIEGRLAVTAWTNDETGPASGLQIGDVVEAVDGAPIASLIEAWSPYYSASNDTTRLRDIAHFLPRGGCGESTLTIERGGERRTVTMVRTPAASVFSDGPPLHDRPGETFQRLSDEVVYLKLSTIRASDVPGYLEQASGTRGLVIDIRNYPSDFVVFALGSRLVEEETPFARFTVGDLGNPGAFRWSPPVTLQPQAPAYAGNVAILVDEISLSQSEYTAMALRAAPRAVVVGSTTAGADGNVSQIPLPGGLNAMMSGIGVFYPDNTPTQRVGIVPDIVVTPTIEGIREGRDEVLEAALRYLLGPDVDGEVLRVMARRP